MLLSIPSFKGLNVLLSLYGLEGCKGIACLLILHSKQWLIWGREVQSAPKVMGTMTIFSLSVLFLSLERKYLCNRVGKVSAKGMQVWSSLLSYLSHE